MQRRIPLIRQLVKMVKGCESLSPPKGYQGPGRKPVAGYMATVGNRPGPCWGLDDFETTRQEFRRNNLCHVTSMLCGISVHEMASWWTNCSKIDPTVTTTWNVARLIFENKMQIDPNTYKTLIQPVTCAFTSYPKTVLQNGFGTDPFQRMRFACPVANRPPPTTRRLQRTVASRGEVPMNWSDVQFRALRNRCWLHIQIFDLKILKAGRNLESTCKVKLAPWNLGERQFSRTKCCKLS